MLYQAQPTHRLLVRQLRKATANDGTIDNTALIALISRSYEENDRTLHLQERAMQLMSDELRALNTTIRREGDELLAQSQKRFELAVEGTNDGIWDWDITADTIWFSLRCKSMLGYTAEQLKDGGIATWYQLIHPEDRAAAEDFITRQLSGQGQSVTLRLMRRDGGVCHIMCRASTMANASGQAIRVVGIHTDVTDLIQMHEELKSARDKAEAASRAKSDFLANMSHEIRTPINAIIGMNHLLLETDLDQQQRLWAGLVRSSSESLLDIINDILDISKIEAGKLDLESVPYDLFDLVEQVTNTLILKAWEKNLELLTYFNLDMPHFFIGDPVRIRQILINLVGNAIKFTQEGYITIRVSLMDIQNDIANLMFQVEDTGLGVPPDKQQYIFEKFSQAEESTTRKFGGTGLGLAICKKLVAMMGGYIAVTSEMGKGSQFFFNVHVPIDRKACANAAQIQPDLSAMRIAVVDDNAMNIAILREYFTAWQIQADFFTEATSALDAIEDATKTPAMFHIALIDYFLPNMNGRAFAAEIKKRGIADIQLAAMRSGDTGNLEELQREGFEALVLKPYTPSRLMNRLTTLWANRAKGIRGNLLTSNPLGSDSALAPRDYSHLNILIVEDLQANQIYLQALLKKHRAPVRVAVNGLEAVAMVAQHHYDIIFMDCQMPEMDGFEATQAIRAMALKQQPFIVALTADAMQGDRERCITAGMDDYLNKPVKAEKITGILAQYVQRAKNYTAA